MKISKAHLRRLKVAKDLRGKNASTIKMLFKNWKYYVLIGGLFAIVSYYFISRGFNGYSYFFGGAFLALLLRDIAWFRLTAKYWPVSDAVTDWDKVDDLIRENET